MTPVPTANSASRIVYAISPEGVRKVTLIARRKLRGRDVCQVWMRGEMAPVTLDPHLVFEREVDARRCWREATAHQTQLRRAGSAIGIVDAHLSLRIARDAA
ncbi:MAG: hypothetical protein B7Y12_02025 [Rhizobiales bacterium 24-66-13]|jgi:hypothetical protein|nr:MAG: hypothetical protein B7Y61_01055 [Rhizobiales bacterium 35-66-30]OYZ82793.1 MAG: hypothetical protein B7Y12_02025 [Rhizobiales bacterium 24-66-13]OZB11826.1 MAG: hypothetical protein B7X67_02005 [Rhizobiales bacterium 39-66-18]HQS09501.1 hypothetical protein [Xanthobacteraceae bacterium]HQS46798.1 hypothetical protein [Xanthobacteraceae bacterium]